ACRDLRRRISLPDRPSAHEQRRLGHPGGPCTTSAQAAAQLRPPRGRIAYNGATRMNADPRPDLDTLLAAEFPLEPGLVYLNHAAVAPWPRRTADAVRAFAEENARLG